MRLLRGGNLHRQAHNRNRSSRMKCSGTHSSPDQAFTLFVSFLNSDVEIVECRREPGKIVRSCRFKNNGRSVIRRYAQFEVKKHAKSRLSPWERSMLRPNHLAVHVKQSLRTPPGIRHRQPFFAQSAIECRYKHKVLEVLEP